jgi:superfamily II DNA/RNA helicase
METNLLTTVRADISAVLRNARPDTESEPSLGPGQRRRQKNQRQHPGSAMRTGEQERRKPRQGKPRQDGARQDTARPDRAPRPERLRLVPDAATDSAETTAPVWVTAPETPDSTATFASLGVPSFLVAVLEGAGITTPFPIQAATLPDALAGRDILGRAKTGSGKTLGFSLPLVARLASGVTAPGRPRGLVLVPTRELATQVQEVLEPLAEAMGLRVATIFGGVSYRPQISAMSRRTDIVVACPGRLMDIIGQGHCDLSDVEITVLDEADHMADLGFLPTVRKLLDGTPGDGQRLLFSATLDGAVDVLAKAYMTRPVLHSVDEASSPANLEHHVFTVAFEHRVGVVADLVSGDNRSLVFTRTKHGAEKLAKKLTDGGIPAVDLHGNLSQAARARNLGKFSAGHVRVLVATDVAARGIHVDGVDLVIHADPPAEHKAYVHRSGRTARGGANGTVVTIQTKSQSRDVNRMMREIGVQPSAAPAEPGAQVLRAIAGPVAEPPAVPEPEPQDRPRRGRRPGGYSRAGGQSGQSRHPRRSWQQDGRAGRPGHFGGDAGRAGGNRRDTGRQGGTVKAS